jgi:hypothetical protein
MGHEDYGFGALFNGIFDCRQSAYDALVIGNDGGIFFIEGDIEVDLFSSCQKGFSWSLDMVPTRIKTRLSLRSTSLIESLLARDMMSDICEWESIGENEFGKSIDHRGCRGRYLNGGGRGVTLLRLQ